jgi:hypothetical protein
MEIEMTAYVMEFHQRDIRSASFPSAISLDERRWQRNFWTAHVHDGKSPEVRWKSGFTQIPGRLHFAIMRRAFFHLIT